MTSSDARTDTPARVVVIGAGIAGLAAAAAIRRTAPGVEVLVLESSPTIGGKLARAEVGGVTVDVGAEAMLNRRPEAVELARRSGLGDKIVHPATTTANLWSRGRLRPMPRTLMGVPADARALADSGVISKSGLARVALERGLPATHLDGQDVSIGWLVEERFGKEVVDRLVEPLLGGVYAGHAREISARAAVPQVVALLDQDRSMMKAAATALQKTSDVPVFAGLVGGIGQLPGAVVASAGLDVRTDATVRELGRAADGGWNLVIGPTRDPEVLHADAVVVATPARPASRLLADVVPDAALELARIEYASMAIVTLAFRARDFPATEGSGFLVPPVDGRSVKASTYSFAKWGWVRAAGAGRRRRGRAALLHRPAPRGAGAAAHGRRGRPAGAGGPRGRDRPLRATGRRARPAVGRRAAAVRRRARRPGAQHPRLRRRRRGARGLRRGVRRTGHPGLRRVGRGGRDPGPRGVGGEGRMNP